MERSARRSTCRFAELIFSDLQIMFLRHASADVTQVYAERDLERAAEIMRQVG
jgi:hypothetical protein